MGLPRDVLALRKITIKAERKRLRPWSDVDLHSAACLVRLGELRLGMSRPHLAIGVC